MRRAQEIETRMCACIGLDCVQHVQIDELELERGLAPADAQRLKPTLDAISNCFIENRSTGAGDHGGSSG